MARTAILTDTLKRLFARSGNRCAFPECSHALFNSDDTFIAQICHIEAAEEGGERYNPAQTDEERRGLSNLLIMCHAHHKVTDDVILYTVDRLKHIKAEHERKYGSSVFVVNDITLEKILNDLTNRFSPLIEAAVQPLHDVMKEVAQGVEKLNARNSIEVTITNETREGPSGPEKKGVRVQIHKEKLDSESAILAALAIGGFDVRNADEIIQRVVQNPELWRKLEESRSNFEEQRVDSTIEEMLGRFQRTGPTPEAIRELDALFGVCFNQSTNSTVTNGMEKTTLGFT